MPVDAVSNRDYRDIMKLVLSLLGKIGFFLGIPLGIWYTNVTEFIFGGYHG